MAKKIAKPRTKPLAGISAEEAYALAAEKLTPTAAEAPLVDAEPVVEATPVVVADEPVEITPVVETAAPVEAAVAIEPTPEPVAEIEPALAPKLAVKKAKPVALVAKKPVLVRKPVKPAKAARRIILAPTPAAKKAKPAIVSSKPAKTGAKTFAFPKIPLISQLKDTIMTTTKTTDFTAMFSGVVTEAQEMAKAALEKSTAAIGEYGDFAKGNVEAVVESGKIMAAGVKDLGETLVADGESAFETMTADAKELAAVKSPADFFKLQGDLMRRNFDAAVAYGSKQSEAMLKLASDSVAPISGRVSIAVVKIKKAA